MYLLKEADPSAPAECEEFLGNSTLVRELLREARRAAERSDKPILITGAVGVGKSHLARQIHGWSSRASRPLRVIDCGSLPQDLDNVLFGHRAGAFTGAVRDLGGRLQEASGGTLVLEDFDRLSLHHQDQFHRVLTEGRFFPVGSTREIRVDLRFIATTNKDVRREVEAGHLKEDFVSRLDYLPLHVPPLHRRPEDIPLLAAELLQRHLDDLRRKGIPHEESLVFHEDCGPALQARAFDDNVRGLDKLVARLVARIDEGRSIILPADIERVSPAVRGSDHFAFDQPKPLRMVRDAAEQRYILDICRFTDWNLRRASRILGISPKSLYVKLKQYGISRPM